MSNWSTVNVTKFSPFQISSLQSDAAVRIEQLAPLPAEAGSNRRTRTSVLCDRAWLASVDLLDGVLRWHYGVHEYSDHADCVFRVALARTERPVGLADGTVVPVGADICHLHFWNEHLPRFPQEGPDLSWAQTMRSKIRHSLELLCLHMERDPAWEAVTAVQASASLPLRPRARDQMQRLAQWHGFEIPTCEVAERGRIRELAENMLLWGFVRAYNPGALSRRDLCQDRQALLLSRSTLLARYGTLLSRVPSSSPRA